MREGYSTIDQMTRAALAEQSSTMATINHVGSLILLLLSDDFSEARLG